MTTTYEEVRTEPERVHDAEVLRRVRRGIELLKREWGEDFADHIDLEALNLASEDACVLGQLYEGGDWGEEDGFGMALRIIDGEMAEEPALFGFDAYDAGSDEYEDLTEAWRDELIRLRGERS